MNIFTCCVLSAWIVARRIFLRRMAASFQGLAVVVILHSVILSPVFRNRLCRLQSEECAQTILSTSGAKLATAKSETNHRRRGAWGVGNRLAGLPNKIVCHRFILEGVIRWQLPGVKPNIKIQFTRLSAKCKKCTHWFRYHPLKQGTHSQKQGSTAGNC